MSRNREPRTPATRGGRERGVPSWWPRLLLVLGLLEIGVALVSGRLFALAGGLVLVAMAAPSLARHSTRRLEDRLDERPWLLAALIVAAIVVPILLLAVDVASQRG